MIQPQAEPSETALLGRLRRESVAQQAQTKEMKRNNLNQSA